MNVTDKTAWLWVRTEEHAPAKWRVNGVVSNLDAYARAYKCKAVRPMVNQESCRIW
jgi:predicted metalloendopeptidase